MSVLNAHQMLVKGAKLAGQDSTDTTLLGEWNDAFLSGINQAYIDLYRALNVRIWEAEALTATKTFLTSGLSLTPDEIFAVAEHIPHSAAASYSDAQKYDFYPDGATIYVPGASESQTVYVQYRPLPALLVNPDPEDGVGATSPTHIPEQHQDCMIYKGLAEVYSSQDDAEAMAKWEMKYFQARSNIRKPNPQRKIKNVQDY
jgi:hypothetical protein